MFSPAGRGLGAAILLLLMAAASGSPACARTLGGPVRQSPLLPRVAAALRAGRPLRIIAFGSSSTEGAGASSRAASYPSRLQADLVLALPHEPVAVDNRGRGGEDALEMIMRLPAVVGRRPDLVIWQLGTNAALHGLPLTEFVFLTRAGIGAIRRSGADVMLIEPQLCRAMNARPGAYRYRDAVRAIGAELGVPVIRRYDLMKEWLSDGEVSLAQLMSGDGLHMADKGYALLAREVARVILQGAGMMGSAAARVN